MEYELSQVNQMAEDPVEFVIWLNDEGFLDTDSVKCAKCGKGTVVRRKLVFL
jgi:hypothetical protein